MISINKFLKNIKLHYLYHLVNKDYEQFIKKYGLCSPKALYDIDQDLFMKTTGKNYKDRAKSFLKKSKLTPEDIIYYLDNAPKRKIFTSTCIFFSYFSMIDHNPMFLDIFKNSIEYKINSEYLKQYNPIQVQYFNTKETTWNEILKDEYLNKINDEIKYKPSNSLVFLNITHVAMKIYKIEYNKLIYNLRI